MANIVTELQGEIISLDKETRTGRFRCSDSSEITFVIAKDADPGSIYELFGKKNVWIGGLFAGHV